MKRLSLYVLSFILAVQLALLSLYPPNNILSYDIFGYYLYLPQTFIYHDLAIKDEKKVYDIIDKYHNSETFYQAAKSKHNEQYVMKYSMGMAILYSPFFTVAHIYAKTFNYEADGYSKPYQRAILYGSFLYSLLGLVFLRKLLKLFFDERTIAITLFAVAFASNYFAHIFLFGQNAMSHNPLFALYVLIMYCTIRWHKNYQSKYSIALGICIGLAALIRPSEIIAVLIPLFYNVASSQQLKDKLKLLLQQNKQILIMTFLIFAIGSLQLIYFKLYAGKLIYNSYGANPGEGFEFAHPYILEVLFSFRKGWIIYTPIILFFIAGMFNSTFKTTGFKLSIIVFFLLNLYIVSSWSCWWYAGCFGQRALIPCIAVLSLPFASLVTEILGSRLRIAFFACLILFTFLNLFQSWQLAKGILPDDRITKAFYKSTFLQTTPPSKEENQLLLIDRGKTLNDNISEEGLSKLIPAKTGSLSFEDETNSLCDTAFYGVKSHAIGLDDASPVIRIPYGEMTGKYYAIIKVSAYYFKDPGRDCVMKLKIAMEHNGYEYKLRTKVSGPEQKNGWNKIELMYLTPEVRRRTDNVKIYIENHSKMPVCIDELKYETFEPKEDVSVF